MSTHRLQEFEGWLLRRGRDSVTAASYHGAVRRALEYDDPVDALLVKKFAPLYRRFIYSALRAWSKFLGDGDLLARLEDIRLPPAMPKDPGEPFDEKVWIRLIEAIESDRSMPDARRLALCLIAVRGIRIGDVCRIKRSEIQAAVKTGTLPFEAKRGKRLRFAVTATRPYLEALLELPWRGRTHLRELIVGPGKHQQKQAARALRRELAKVAEAVGLDPSEVHPHRFRYTAAQEFLRQVEGDPEAVLLLKDWMQWSNLNTAMSYLHRDRSRELEAIEQRMLARRKR